LPEAVIIEVEAEAPCIPDVREDPESRDAEARREVACALKEENALRPKRLDGWDRELLDCVCEANEEEFVWSSRPAAGPPETGL